MFGLAGLFVTGYNAGMNTHTSLTVELTQIAATGEAIGWDEEGRVVFVADAIPGETVEVEIIEEKKRWRRGILRQVLKGSPDRVMAPCPYFGPPQPVSLPDGHVLNPAGTPRCAGCLWQQIDYERQLTLKREIVVNALTRSGRLGKTPAQSQQIAEMLVAEVVALGARDTENTVLDFGFRTQMRFGLGQSGQLTLPGRSGDSVAIAACPLHHPQLAELFAEFSLGEVQSNEKDDFLEAVESVTLAVGGTSDFLLDDATDIKGATAVLVLYSRRDEPPGLDLELPVNVFLIHDEPCLELLIGDWNHTVQVDDHRLTAYPPIGAPGANGRAQGDAPRTGHLLTEEVLVAVVVELLELQTFEHLLELEADIGARTVLLAEQVATVVAVLAPIGAPLWGATTELAMAALQANVAGLDNVAVRQGEILPTVRKLRRAEYRFDAVLLTPADGIINAELFSLLTRMRIRRCGLIIDDPVQLARALTAIDEAGYRLTAVQPIDLQPHHPGVTLVARFDRKS